MSFKTIISLALCGVLLSTQCGCPKNVNLSRKKSARQKPQRESLGEHDEKILVTPEWLNQQLKFETVHVLDLSFRESQFQTNHIPGAKFVDWRSDLIDVEKQDYYQLPSKQKMEALLGRLGVTPDSVIVLTDNMQNRTAVRMYFTLKYFGHKDVRVLNGGNDAWEADGLTFTIKDEPIEPTTYTITEEHPDMIVQIDTVRRIVDDGSAHLVDGRPVAQYTGEIPGKAFHTNKPHKHPGHISTARSIPWKANLSTDNTFKSLDDLRALYEQHEIDREDIAIAYCNEGLHATVSWFVLHELLQYKNVQVYDNSLSEWANLDDTPMTEGYSR